MGKIPEFDFKNVEDFEECLIRRPDGTIDFEYQGVVYTNIIPIKCDGIGADSVVFKEGHTVTFKDIEDTKLMNSLEKWYKGI